MTVSSKTTPRPGPPNIKEAQIAITGTGESVAANGNTGQLGLGLHPTLSLKNESSFTYFLRSQWFLLLVAKENCFHENVERRVCRFFNEEANHDVQEVLPSRAWFANEIVIESLWPNRLLWGHMPLNNSKRAQI